MFTGSSNVNTLASGMEFEDRVENPSNLPESKDLSCLSISTQQIPDLITLSLLPRSQWQSLINLDIIKVSFYCYLIPPPHRPQQQRKKENSFMC